MTTPRTEDEKRRIWGVFRRQNDGLTVAELRQNVHDDPPTCRSRAGRVRPEHQLDLSGRCLWCDWLDPLPGEPRGGLLS